ncbi:MAG: hypothetical protein ACLP5H_19310 [Desulfomonilaceae bacterium]
MGKKTYTVKKILSDIKLGMDNSTLMLMTNYDVSETNLQSLFKKPMDAKVLKPKQSEPEKRPSEFEKASEQVGNALSVENLSPKPERLRAFARRAFARG